MTYIIECNIYKYIIEIGSYIYYYIYRGLVFEALFSHDHSTMHSTTCSRISMCIENTISLSIPLHFIYFVFVQIQIVFLFVYGDGSVGLSVGNRDLGTLHKSSPCAEPKPPGTRTHTARLTLRHATNASSSRVYIYVCTSEGSVA